MSVKTVQPNSFLASPYKTISNSNDESYLNDDELNDKVFIHPETINSSLGSLNKKDYQNNLLETTKRDHKSRSMSLPVTYSDIDLFSSDQESSQSGFQQVSSSSNNSLLSPMRKFDFTFCKSILVSYLLITFQTFSLTKKKFLLFFSIHFLYTILTLNLLFLFLNYKLKALCIHTKNSHKHF